MEITHFILERILKLLTYYTTRLSIISRCKVNCAQKQSSFFGPPCSFSREWSTVMEKLIGWMQNAAGYTLV